jgi:hypothetical protein
MDTLDEEAQKKGPLPPHARRLIDKMVETVNEMERESADCAAQFEAVTRNLKQVSVCCSSARTPSHCVADRRRDYGPSRSDQPRHTFL